MLAACPQGCLRIYRAYHIYIYIYIETHFNDGYEGVYIRETGLLRTVEIELAIAMTFLAAHLKDELLNFQNLQKNQKSVTRNFF